MKQKEYNFNQISQTRGDLFGISALLIIVFHSINLLNASPSPLINNIFKIILHYGNIGVDVFLILSGVGLYYSYSANENTKEFYKRRALRLLPALLIVALAFSGARLLLHDITPAHFIESVTMTLFFVNGDREFWFFSLLILLYTFYPPLYYLLKKHGAKGLAIVFAAVCATLVILGVFFPKQFNDYEIAIIRVLPFSIGAWLGKYIKSNITVRLKIVVIACVLTLILSELIFVSFFEVVNKQVFLLRLLYCPMALSFIIILSLLIQKFNKFVRRILVWFGLLSLELYLIYEKLDYAFQHLLSYAKINGYSWWLYYLVLFLITVALAMLLNKVCTAIKARLKKKS